MHDAVADAVVLQIVHHVRAVALGGGVGDGVGPTVSTQGVMECSAYALVCR